MSKFSKTFNYLVLDKVIDKSKQVSSLLLCISKLFKILYIRSVLRIKIHTLNMDEFDLIYLAKKKCGSFPSSVNLKKKITYFSSYIMYFLRCPKFNLPNFKGWYNLSKWDFFSINRGLQILSIWGTEVLRKWEKSFFSFFDVHSDIFIKFRKYWSTKKFRLFMWWYSPRMSKKKRKNWTYYKKSIQRKYQF